MKLRSGTCEGFFWPSLGEDVQVLQRHHDPLDAAKHGGKSETEEHNEEQHCPQRRNGHFGDGLSEHNEGQTSTFYSLKEHKEDTESKMLIHLWGLFYIRQRKHSDPQSQKINTSSVGWCIRLSPDLSVIHMNLSYSFIQYTILPWCNLHTDFMYPSYNLHTAFI